MPIEFFLNDENIKEQKITVSGNVSNKVTGNPIEGALILVKGPNRGAITDKDGNFSIDVPGEAFELEFSSLGYGKSSEKIWKNRTINVELIPEDLVLDFSSD